MKGTKRRLIQIKLLLLFFILSSINVVFSTIKSLVTIKGNAFTASILSALYYAYYNIVIIYTVAEFPLWQKIIVTFVCNLLGVFIVKYFEQRARKDKLWKVECTILSKYTDEAHKLLNEFNIPHNYVENVGKYTLLNMYCATQEESKVAKQLIQKYDAHYFVSESKEL